MCACLDHKRHPNIYKRMIILLKLTSGQKGPNSVTCVSYEMVPTMCAIVLLQSSNIKIQGSIRGQYTMQARPFQMTLIQQNHGVLYDIDPAEYVLGQGKLLCLFYHAFFYAASVIAIHQNRFSEIRKLIYLIVDGQWRNECVHLVKQNGKRL